MINGNKVESHRFLPVNTAPEQFMRPPTESLDRTFIDASIELEAKINRLAAESTVPGQEVLSSRRPLCSIKYRPILNIGSELEIFLFSNKSTPHADDLLTSTGTNPNYFPRHMKLLREIRDAIILPAKEGGLGEIIMPKADLDSLMLEVRTPPGTVDQYVRAISQIQAWLSTKSAAKGINPAIYSQHFHFSLTDPTEEQNLLKDAKHYDAVHAGVVDIYHRAIPLLRLPEEFDEATTPMGETPYRYGRLYGIHKTGIEGERDERKFGTTRIECRVNSSEYAHDPYLNLFIHLLGVYRGLNAKDNPSSLHDDYRIPCTASSNGRPYFEFGGPNGIAYEEAMAHITEDSVLNTALPKETVGKIHQVIQIYPDISAGKVTLTQAREAASVLLASS